MSAVHGRRVTYVMGGCRCDPCRTAAAAYKRAWKARSQHSFDPARCGTYAQYTTWDCRCGPCRKAKTAYQRQYRASRRPPEACPRCWEEARLYRVTGRWFCADCLGELLLELPSLGRVA